MRSNYQASWEAPSGPRSIDRIWYLVGTVAAMVVAFVLVLAPRTALAAESSPMYRLYNHYNGDHMYTLNVSERDNLVNLGWDDEGIAWRVPETGDSVWRLYNPYSGEHLFTLDRSEYLYLQTIGWNGEGEGFKSAGSAGVPIYRLYNRWLTAGTHLYTTNRAEYLNLEILGWSGEHVAFYGARATLPQTGSDVTLNGTIRIVHRSWLTNLLGITEPGEADDEIAVFELDRSQDLTLPDGDVQRTHNVSFVLLPDSFAVENNRDRSVTLNFDGGSLQWSRSRDGSIVLPIATSGVHILD